MPLPICALPGKPQSETNIDVIVFVSTDPSGRFHLSFWHHNACVHAGMNFITGTVKETGIDKDDTILSGFDARFQIQCGTSLFHP